MTEPGRGITPARVGIIGCGNVTRLYLPGTGRFPEIVLAACADRDPARSAELSAAGGFPAMSVEALLADPSIEVVLNLTPPTVHAEVSRAVIASGKHLYSEKPLATDREDAAGILRAAGDAGVRLGAAPDTFLGGGPQRARQLLDDGRIGQPIAAFAAVAHLGPERWHPDPAFFYAPGGGPLLDIGPYYVAALVHLLGPVVEVSAVGTGIGGQRAIGSGPRAGATFPVSVPTTAIAGLRFASGVVGSLIASFDVAASTVPHLEIHGTRGSLALGDPNGTDSSVSIHEADGDGWSDAWGPVVESYERGIGLADLIGAIRTGRPVRPSGEFAFHVLDVLLATQEADASGRPVPVTSTCERPAPLASVDEALAS